MKQAISLDAATASCRLQPVYFEGVWNSLLAEILDCDWSKHRPRAERIAGRVEEEWNRWRKAKALIDADWHAEQLKRVEAVALEIDRDRQKQMMEEEEAKLAVYQAQDRLEEGMWLEKIVTAIKKENDEWLKAAQRRLVAATKDMNRDTVKTERKVFAERGIFRGRRNSA